MPLQGDLKEFGVPDLFQFLDQHGKSGCVQITSEGDPVEVYFRSGKIVGVLPGGRNVGDQVLQILARLGYLTEEDARKIRKRRETDLRGIRRILQEMGIIDSRDLDALFHQQVEELIYPLFRVRKGRFSFYSDRLLPSELEFLEPLAVEPLVLDGLRRLDEWPLIRKRIGSYGGVPYRKAAAPSGASPRTGGWLRRLFGWIGFRGQAASEPLTSPIDAPDSEEVSNLSAAAKWVYRLVDGNRRISEILEISNLGEYVTCKALLTLQEQGWIGIDPYAPQREAGRAVQLAGRQARNWVLSSVLFGAGAVSVLLAALVLARGLGGTDWTALKGRETMARLFNQQARQVVIDALELYRLERGSYPERLEDLAEARLLDPETLHLKGDNEFSYRREGPLQFRLHISPVPAGEKPRT
jgi:hypothetical protein